MNEPDIPDRGIESKPPPVARWREVFQGRRGRLTAGLLLLEALVAVQVLVVAAIMPAIRADLHGLRLYGWAFSATGLATIASIPIAGRAADRFGPVRLLAITLSVQVVGLMVAALTPNMLLFVAGRFLQGFAAGSLYAVSLGTVAKTYPERIRPRVLALLATMWILPGLFAPPLGALLASTVGWRWAFVAPLPLLGLSFWLVFPPLRDVPMEGRGDVRVPLRWPIQLTLGAGLVLGGLTATSVPGLALVAAGLVVGVPALKRVVPPGTFRARPGLPAAVATSFLLSVAFVAADAFVPLMLTAVRHLSVGQASLVVTLVSVTWGLGSWWQSRAIGRISPAALVSGAAVVLALGILAVASGLGPFPIFLPYLGWTIAGIGMGVAFPTIPLVVMGAASRGNESSELSSALLMDMLGTAIGAGLGGASVAASRTSGASLKLGIAGALVVAFLAACALAVVARRLPAGPTPNR